MKKIRLRFSTDQKGEIDIATVLVKTDPEYVTSALEALARSIRKNIPESSRLLTLKMTRLS